MNVAFSPLLQIYKNPNPAKSFTKLQISMMEKLLLDLKSENDIYKSSLKKLTNSSNEVLKANVKLQDGIADRRNHLQSLTTKLSERSITFLEHNFLRETAKKRLIKYHKYFSDKTGGIARDKIGEEIDLLRQKIDELREQEEKYKKDKEDIDSILQNILSLGRLKMELENMNLQLNKEANKLLNTINFEELDLNPTIENRISAIRVKMEKSEKVRKDLEKQNNEYDILNGRVLKDNEFYQSLNDKLNETILIFDQLDQLFLNDLNSKSDPNLSKVSSNYSNLSSLLFDTDRVSNFTNLPNYYSDVPFASILDKELQQQQQSKNENGELIEQTKRENVNSRNQKGRPIILRPEIAYAMNMNKNSNRSLSKNQKASSAVYAKSKSSNNENVNKIGAINSFPKQNVNPILQLPPFPIDAFDSTNSKNQQKHVSQKKMINKNNNNNNNDYSENSEELKNRKNESDSDLNSLSSISKEKILALAEKSDSISISDNQDKAKSKSNKNYNSDDSDSNDENKKKSNLIKKDKEKQNGVKSSPESNKKQNLKDSELKENQINNNDLNSKSLNDPKNIKDKKDMRSSNLENDDQSNQVSDVSDQKGKKRRRRKRKKSHSSLDNSSLQSSDVNTTKDDNSSLINDLGKNELNDKNRYSQSPKSKQHRSQSATRSKSKNPNLNDSINISKSQDDSIINASNYSSYSEEDNKSKPKQKHSQNHNYRSNSQNKGKNQNNNDLPSENSYNEKDNLVNSNNNKETLKNNGGTHNKNKNQTKYSSKNPKLNSDYDDEYDDYNENDKIKIKNKNPKGINKQSQISKPKSENENNDNKINSTKNETENKNDSKNSINKPANSQKSDSKNSINNPVNDSKNNTDVDNDTEISSKPHRRKKRKHRNKSKDDDQINNNNNKFENMNGSSNAEDENEKDNKYNNSKAQNKDRNKNLPQKNIHNKMPNSNLNDEDYDYENKEQSNPNRKGNLKSSSSPEKSGNKNKQKQNDYDEYDNANDNNKDNIKPHKRSRHKNSVKNENEETKSKDQNKNPSKTNDQNLDDDYDEYENANSNDNIKDNAKPHKKRRRKNSVKNENEEIKPRDQNKNPSKANDQNLDDDYDEYENANANINDGTKINTKPHKKRRRKNSVKNKNEELKSKDQYKNYLKANDQNLNDYDEYDNANDNIKNNTKPHKGSKHRNSIKNENEELKSKDQNKNSSKTNDQNLDDDYDYEEYRDTNENGNDRNDLNHDSIRKASKRNKQNKNSDAYNKKTNSRSKSPKDSNHKRHKIIIDDDSNPIDMNITDSDDDSHKSKPISSKEKSKKQKEQHSTSSKSYKNQSNSSNEPKDSSKSEDPNIHHSKSRDSIFTHEVDDDDEDELSYSNSIKSNCLQSHDKSHSSDTENTESSFPFNDNEGNVFASAFSLHHGNQQAKSRPSRNIFRPQIGKKANNLSTKRIKGNESDEDLETISFSNSPIRTTISQKDKHDDKSENDVPLDRLMGQIRNKSSTAFNLSKSQLSDQTDSVNQDDQMSTESSQNDGRKHHHHRHHSASSKNDSKDDTESVISQSESYNGGGFYKTEATTNIFINKDTIEEIDPFAGEVRTAPLPSQTKWAQDLLRAAISRQLNFTRLQVAISEAQYQLSKINNEIMDLEDECLMRGFERRVRNHPNLRLVVPLMTLFVPPSASTKTASRKRSIPFQTRLTGKSLMNDENEILKNNEFLAKESIIDSEKMICNAHLPMLEKALEKVMRANDRMDASINQYEEKLGIVDDRNKGKSSKETRLRMRYERALNEARNKYTELDDRIAKGFKELEDTKSLINDQRELHQKLKERIEIERKAAKPNVPKMTKSLNGYKAIEKWGNEKIRMMQLEEDYLDLRIAEKSNDLDIDKLEIRNAEFLVQINALKDKFFASYNEFCMKNRMKSKKVRMFKKATSENEIEWLNKKIKQISADIEIQKSKKRRIIDEVKEAAEKLVLYKLNVPPNSQLDMTLYN